MIDKLDIMKLNELSIEQVAEALGLSVCRHRALCPFHNDSNPSLTFSVRKNRYRCFVCGASGGPIDLVMNYLHKPFLEACHWLSSMDPSTLISQPSTDFPQPSTLNPHPNSLNPQLSTLNLQPPDSSSHVVLNAVFTTYQF